MTAVLTGRGTLADRLGGRLGRFAAALLRRLMVGEGPPPWVPLAQVLDIGNHVAVSLAVADMPNHVVEDAEAAGPVWPRRREGEGYPRRPDMLANLVGERVR